MTAITYPQAVKRIDALKTAVADAQERLPYGTFEDRQLSSLWHLLHGCSYTAAVAAVADVTPDADASWLVSFCTGEYLRSMRPANRAAS